MDPRGMLGLVGANPMILAVLIIALVIGVIVIAAMGLVLLVTGLFIPIVIGLVGLIVMLGMVPSVKKPWNFVLGLVLMGIAYYLLVVI